MASPVPTISVRYPVPLVQDAWVLPEGPVPESTTHDAAVQRLKLLLDAWVERTGRPARIARNLAIRWAKVAPTVGIDPDVCVIEPAPAEEHLRSLRTWQPEHAVPRLCFEIVSETHPYKDYAGIQDRYAAMGALELVVFDPLLAGPPKLGGPVLFQVWRRDASGALERVHFGGSPAYSTELGAWLHRQGNLLDIADDREGLARWQTGEEHERAEKERERAEKEYERAEKERERAEKEQGHGALAAAEQKIRELEERLRKHER
jgi:Uma2 family endonuclease